MSLLIKFQVSRFTKILELHLPIWTKILHKQCIYKLYIVPKCCEFLNIKTIHKKDELPDSERLTLITVLPLHWKVFESLTYVQLNGCVGQFVNNLLCGSIQDDSIKVLQKWNRNLNRSVMCLWINYEFSFAIAFHMVLLWLR